jgi:outer membrane protein assembly factor BamB
VVVGVLVTLVVIKLTGSSADRSAPTSPTPVPTATAGVPTRPTVFRPAQALDVVVDGDSQWVLSGNALSLSRDGEVVHIMSLGALHLEATSTPLLALDQSRRVIWLVVANAVPTRMIEFDSRTLRALVTVTWQQLVYGAAAVNGYLYLANDLGVAEVSPYTLHPRLVPGLRGAMGPIAADPAGHQLFAVDASTRLAVYSYRHGERPRESGTRLPIRMGSLAVADGYVWVGGYGEHDDARLYRIDPRTLEPVSGGRVATFDPGAVVISAGRHVIWVRNGGVSSDLFACVDAVTGRIEQRFHLSSVDRVASTDGVGVVATDQGVLQLTMGGCAG